MHVSVNLFNMIVSRFLKYTHIINNDTICIIIDNMRFVLLSAIFHLLYFKYVSFLIISDMADPRQLSAANSR
ncbi:hypothetical protein U27_05908 [Candidatus Vecturithrix granuli]|uniref:Uncharacterized protein n=1 Tax=Vecturithrix granuli TaxID=1499967 RepID=A0A081C2X8_VECG1|nr:hypothetical protein U27_05908 [Candidatus Vecturithrix granuli]